MTSGRKEGCGYVDATTEILDTRAETGIPVETRKGPCGGGVEYKWYEGENGNKEVERRETGRQDRGGLWSATANTEKAIWKPITFNWPQPWALGPVQSTRYEFQLLYWTLNTVFFFLLKHLWYHCSSGQTLLGQLLL